MEVSRRIFLCRIAEKLSKNKNYAKKIGTVYEMKITTEEKSCGEVKRSEVYCN